LPGLITFALMACGARLDATPATWGFSPPSVGRALFSGGWMVEYPLGEVDASPEFRFPLQLVYLSNRTREGLFGNQWFCPQLESSVVPVGRGSLLWTMPSGQQMVFQQDGENKTEYISPDRTWRAKVLASKQQLTSANGWEYQYSKGKLESVLSPSHRILEFEWLNNYLTGIQIRDFTSNSRRVIFLGQYGDDKRLASFKLDGQIHKFAYVKEGTQEHLSAWGPPVGEAVKFLYLPGCGVLAMVGTGDTEDPSRIETFKTEFVNPSSKGPQANEIMAKKQAANYWLVQDRIGSYAYGRLGKGGSQWNPAEISLTSRTGLAQKASYAEQRGIVTTQQDGKELKSYYYRAPGQKYDGKLRRTEVDGQMKEEYRYDRKTGLLTETIDDTGKITFFDYDPDPRAAHRMNGEPQPVRVRRGSRKSAETIAEYAYAADGKLIAEKDGHGNLTRYAYNARGELASVTNPAGDTVSYTYNEFGKCDSMTRAGHTEHVAYDECGRLKDSVAADGTKTEMIYDAAGQLVRVKRNGKVAKELVRDEFHRVVGEKDALNRLSRVERDGHGNLLAQYAPNGSVTRYEYDAFDRRTAQIDGNGSRITFAYDSAGRMTRQMNALGNAQTWIYDQKTGKLVERDNGEQYIHHSYDKEGKLTTIDYGRGQMLSYSYDKEKRPVAIGGPDASFEYSYDDEGRLAATRAVCSGDDQLLAYRYNRRGQRTGLLVSRLAPAAPANGGVAGKPAHYEILQQTEQTYDPSGNLSAILTDGVPAISYRYDAAGRPVQKTYGTPKNGKPAMTTDIGYDSMGHLARMEFKGGKLTAPLLLTYEWDEGDQLTRRTWNGRTHRYEYDRSGQLLKVIDDGSQSVLEAYTYDKAGNMLTKLILGQLTAMTYNAGNQVVKSCDLGQADPKTIATLPKSPDALEKLAKTTLTYTYDKAGRMLGTGSQPANTYGWLDKLIATAQPGGGKTTHSYWPDGQPAAITAGLVPSSPTSRAANPPSDIRNLISAIRNPQSDIHNPQSDIHNPQSDIHNPQSDIHNPKSDIHNPQSPSESFLWDGLALIRRNDTIYIIEPHPSGGIPIASHPIGRPDEITWHLNDLLGTTLATVGPGGVRFAALTTFGQPLKAPSDGGGLTPAGSPPAPARPVPQTNKLPPTRR
jgi:YD repeat-containing protein